jgi:flagellar protein FlgJ
MQGTIGVGQITTAEASPAPPAPDPRLKPAAREFEASLMKELLEPLQHDPLFGGGNVAESADGSGNALMSFGSEALAKAISDRGGFGIANSILAHFAQHEKPRGTSSSGG